MSESVIERVAAAMAEKANGGKFRDPLFYAPEHRAFWLDVVRAGLEELRDPPEDVVDAGRAVTATWRNIPGSGLMVAREKMRLRWNAMLSAAATMPEECK